MKGTVVGTVAALVAIVLLSLFSESFKVGPSRGITPVVSPGFCMEGLADGTLWLEWKARPDTDHPTYTCWDEDLREKLKQFESMR